MAPETTMESKKKPCSTPAATRKKAFGAQMSNRLEAWKIGAIISRTFLRPKRSASQPTGTPRTTAVTAIPVTMPPSTYCCAPLISWANN